MIDIVALITRIDPSTAYAVTTAVVFADSLLVVGAFVPTFTVLAAAGALGRTGHLDIAIVIALAGCAVIAGDFVAHRLGRHLARHPDRRSALLRRIPVAAIDTVESLLRRYGNVAVLIGRFIPIVRMITPHLVGATGISYRHIALFSITGAFAWASAYALIGYSISEPLGQLASSGGAAIVALAAVTGGIFLAVRAVRAKNGGASAPGSPAATSHRRAPIQR